MNTDSEKQDRFEALARAYGADLYRFGLWLCGDEALARDLVQETFLRAWRALDSLKDEGAAKSWLITILRREWARTFERKTPGFTNIEALELEDADEPAPEERLEREQLRGAMLSLAPRYREPLLLQVLFGYSCEEIASMLGIGKGAVMTQLFRAREQVKEKLQRDGLTGTLNERF